MRKRNGKGKEYDNNCELKFEGEYLNGERNEKGTQYFDGMVYFEGEFKNGKFWNGIFYEDDGYDDFEFELINGNGEIKNYSKYAGLVLERGYKNGEINGKVKIYNPFKGDLRFESEYKNGKNNGKGKEYFSDEKI